MSRRQGAASCPQDPGSVTNLVVIEVIRVLDGLFCSCFRCVILRPIRYEEVYRDERNVNHSRYQAHPDTTRAVRQHAVHRQHDIVLPVPAYTCDRTEGNWNQNAFGTNPALGSEGMKDSRRAGEMSDCLLSVRPSLSHA